MFSNDATLASTPVFTAIVPGLSVLRDVFANLYYAFPPDQPQGPWVLIDAGLPGSAGKIKKQAEALFGADTPPAPPSNCWPAWSLKWPPQATAFRCTA